MNEGAHGAARVVASVQGAAIGAAQSHNARALALVRLRHPTHRMT